MQRWNWFLSADVEGKWITTHGYAEVSMKEKEFLALLRFSPDTLYHEIKATIGSNDFVEALVASPDSDIPPFKLGGPLFKRRKEDGIEITTIFLTDGTTMIGLTYGPSSHEDNL